MKLINPNWLSKQRKCRCGTSDVIIWIPNLNVFSLRFVVQYVGHVLANDEILSIKDRRWAGDRRDRLVSIFTGRVVCKRR